MRFGILGPLELRDDYTVVPVAAGKQRALVAYLLLHANEPVPTERLVDELWDGEAPATAPKIVQNSVSQLRKTLGDRLVTHGSAYELDVRPGELDVDRFESLVADGRAALAGGDPQRAAALLREGLDVWRGPALADFAYESFAQHEIGRLEDRRLVVIEDRIDADLELGRHADLVGELESLVAAHPFRERLRAQLMVALYRSGRQQEALEAYASARRTLTEELGIEPGDELRSLQRRILEQDPSLQAPRRVPAVAAARGRRAAILIGAGVIILAVAAGALVWQLRSDDGSLSSVAANTVGKVDPSTAEIAGQYAVGRTPTAVTVGEGAVWTLNADARTISRIDPESGRVQTFGTGTTPIDLAAGAGALWVANGERQAGAQFVGPVAKSVSRIDPDHLIVRATIPLPAPESEVSNASGSQIAVGAGGVWVVNPDFGVSRIDPAADRVAATVRDVGAVAVAANRDQVWILSVDGSIARLSPRGDRASRPIQIAASALTDIAVGAGAVWLTDSFEGTVWRVDTRPRVVMRTIPVGSGVNAVAFGEGAVWAVNGLRGTLTRIDPGTNEVTDTITLANTPRDLAVGEQGVWVSVTGGQGTTPAVAAGGTVEGIEPLPASACGPVFYGGDGDPDFLIASDFPLQGGGRFTTLQMSESISFALRRRHFRAGSYRVAYQSCDDSTAQTGIFDTNKCNANAKAYADNPDVIGVIGPYNSFCAVGQIPIAGRAPEGPLAMVTSSASLTSLTQPDPLAPRGFTARLYPAGRRNFARVYGTDAMQGAANAVLARSLGARRVLVLHDGDPVFGLSRAVYFRRAARRLGLELVGFRAWDPEAKDYGALGDAAVRLRPDAVFLGGGLYTNGGAVIAELRSRLGRSVPILAAEFLPVSDVFAAVGPAARGVYVSLIGLTSNGLPPAGRRYSRRFGATQPGGDVDVSSVYAAQALELLLDAIARSDGTRASVTNEVFRGRIASGLTGDVTITPRGDLRRSPITILRAARAGGTNVVQGYEGAVVDRVIVPPEALVR